MKEGKAYSMTEQALFEDIVRLPAEFDSLWDAADIYSNQFGTLPVHERDRRLAAAYLVAAKRLMFDLATNLDETNWPQASVPCFCYYHSVEMFLKACIRYSDPAEQVAGHDVTRLKKRYHDLYPDLRYFGFQTPWDLRLEDLERTYSLPPSGYKFDGKGDQLYRYFAEKDGNPASGAHVVVPRTWFQMMITFEDDMVRIWENIIEQAGPQQNRS
jgi:hypothetical protein